MSEVTPTLSVPHASGIYLVPASCTRMWWRVSNVSKGRYVSLVKKIRRGRDWRLLCVKPLSILRTAISGLYAQSGPSICTVLIPSPLRFEHMLSISLSCDLQFIP